VGIDCGQRSFNLAGGTATDAAKVHYWDLQLVVFM
jgi:hypothetical protein